MVRDVLPASRIAFQSLGLVSTRRNLGNICSNRMFGSHHARCFLADLLPEAANLAIAPTGVDFEDCPPGVRVNLCIEY